MLENAVIQSPEKLMLNWWSKIRWFMVLVLFAIGILRVGQVEQTYPIAVFVATFVGITILNILYHLQLLKSNNLVSSLQIVLDIVFATLVVHLTGGIESSFVWIYLLAVITASLSIETAGGFIAAMIGSMCMLILIISYNYGWLLPVDGADFDVSISNQTIFLISYTGLFSGIAFISSFISGLLHHLSIKIEKLSVTLNEQTDKIATAEKELIESKGDFGKFEEVVSVASSVAGIDHDINNPLTIISLSIRRVKQAAGEYGDEKLSRSATQMTEAINKINGILVRMQKLKRLDLIQEKRKNQQG